MKTKKMLVGGERRTGAETFEVKSPYANEVLAEVSAADASQTEEAIVFAEEASKKMRQLARFEIAKGLRAIASGMERRKKEFAETIANEAAKPINLARGEVERGIATFAWAAGEAERSSAAKSFPLTRRQSDAAKPLIRNTFRAE